MEEQSLKPSLVEWKRGVCAIFFFYILFSLKPSLVEWKLPEPRLEYADVAALETFLGGMETPTVEPLETG